VLVEPRASAALQASARAGRAVAVEPGASLMDGLVVESADQIGFPVLRESAFGFLSVDDSAAASAMRLLARHGCVVGETGVAGWAGLLTSAADPAMRQALGMDSDSRVVVVATEGATDPELYRLRAMSIILINTLL
jgi:diaminopropionate ammonia-lyase